MNHIYKVIWSKAKQSYVVASELAKSHSGKAASGKRAVLAAVLAALTLTGAAVPAYAADAVKTAKTQQDALLLLLAENAKNEETGAAEGTETGTEPQNTKYNENGFYAQQDTKTGYKGVYNSLTKDGLWVGGDADDTGFRVDNKGEVKTTAGITADGTVQAGDFKATVKDLFSDTTYTNSFDAAGLVPGQSQSKYSTAIGHQAFGDPSIGKDANQSVAIGDAVQIKDGGEKSTAIGYGSAIGDFFGSAKQSVAVGANSAVSKDYGVAIGESAKVNTQNGIAIGQKATIGEGAVNSVAIGGLYAYSEEGGLGGGGNELVAANAKNSTVVGAATLSQSEGGTALGKGATVGQNSDGSLALGVDSSVEMGTKNAVAIGANSVADQENTVSVGSDELQRKIVNVADGKVSEGSHDAVTGGQLYDVSQKVTDLDSLAVKYDDATKGSVTFSNTTLKNVNDVELNVKGGSRGLVSSGITPGTVYAKADGWTEGAAADTASLAIGGGLQNSQTTSATVRGKNSIAIGSGASVDATAQELDAPLNGFDNADGVAIGVGSTVSGIQGTAVGYGATVKENQGTAFGNQSAANGNKATAIGFSAVAEADNATVLGQGASVGTGADNSVALGAGSTVFNSDLKDTDKNGVVSVGSGNAERRIIHVADGVDAHDAVNKGQLDTLSDNAVQYDKNEDGTTNYGSVTFKGVKGADEDVGTNLKNIGTISAANGWFYLDNTGKVSTYDVAISDGGDYNSFKDAGLVAGKVTAPASYNTFDNLVIGSGAKIDNMDTENGFAKQNTAVGNKAQILPGYNWGEDSEGKATVERANSVSGSSAFGAGAQVTGNNSSAYGSSASVTNDLGVAIGYNAQAGKSGSKDDDGKATAIGAASNAGGNKSTALGYYAQATVDEGTAVGANTSLGYGTEGSVALGARSVVTKDDLLKDNAGNVTETNGVVSVGDSNYGTNSKYSFQRRIINVADGVNKFDAVNKGQLDAVDTKVTGLSDSAVQYDTKDGTVDYNSVTFKGGKWTGTVLNQVGDIRMPGYTANDPLSFEAAGIVPGVSLSQAKSGIVSLRGSATAMNAIAIGTDAGASQLSSISIGTRAHSDAEYGVALGEGTWIDPVDQKATVKGDKGSVALGAGSTVTKEDTQNGTIGVVSVGSGDKDSRYGATRKIINVTDGDIAKNSNDAVTGGQLYTEQEARKAADQKLTDAGLVFGEISKEKDNLAIGKDSKAIGEENIVLGKGAWAGLGDYDGGTSDQSVILGANAKGTGNQVVAIGHKAEASGGDGNVALGDLAQARDYTGGAVAIGKNAYATYDYTNKTGKGVAIGSDSFAEGNVVSFGHSADDINPSDNSKTFGTDLNRRLIHVADGVDDTDAATVGQVKAADKVFTDAFAAYKAAGITPGTVGDKATAIGDNTKADYQGVALGANANASAVNGVAIGADSVASGGNSTALGYASKATGSQATALGQHAQALAEQSVALGEDSIATEKGTVSVGNGSWLSRRIVNVADGVNDTDAATVGQIKDLAGVDASKGATLQYDLNGDKATNYGSATFAGVTQNVNGKDVNVGTKLNNVNDIALNVQVYKTEADKYEPKADPSIGSYGLITETGTLAGYESRSLTGAGLLPGKVTGDNGKGYNVALGRTTSIDGAHSGSIAVGKDATVIFDDKFNKEPKKGTESPNDAISIGTRTKNYNSFSGVALGASSGVWQSNWGTALGTDSHVDNSYYGTALGVFAKVENSAEGLALGRSAYVKNAAGSVALGTQSVADEENVVSVGHAADDLNRVGGKYGNVLQRRITNVADGKLASDAATYGQLTTLQNQVNGIATPGIQTGSIDNASAKKGNVAIGTESKVTGASNSIAIGRATIDQSGVKNEGFVGEGPWNAIAIGGDNTSVKNSENGIALGAYAEVTNSKWGTALGNGATVRDSEESLAIGHNAKAINAYKSTAVGYGAAALDTAFQSAAFGPSATVKGFNTVALGSQSFASGTNSVALGADSVAAEEKVISVGHKKGDKDAFGFGYQDDLFRKVTNVEAGSQPNDAVIVSQFNGKYGAGDASFLKAVGKIDWKAVAEKSDAINTTLSNLKDNNDAQTGKTASTEKLSVKSLAKADISLASSVKPTLLAAEPAAAGDTKGRNPNGGTTTGGGDKTTSFENGITVKGDSSFTGNVDFTQAASAKVKDGKVEKDSKDIVNGGQLWNEQEARQNADAALGNQIGALNGRVNELGGEIDSVGAISAALAGLHPLDYDPTNSKYQISAAVGTYDGSSAFALGGFYNVNKDTLLSAGVSTVLKGQRKTSANLGVTFRLGAGNSAENAGVATNLNEANQRLAALSQDNKVLEGQNRKLTEKVDAQDQKLTEQDQKLKDLEAKLNELLAKQK